MKKLVLAGAAIALLTSVSAYAGEINLGINLGGPAYVAPAPVIASPGYIVAPAPVPGYYDPHHRRGDYRYWHDRHPDRWHH